MSVLLNDLPITEKQVVVLPELWTSGFSENLGKTGQANIEILNSLRTIAKSRNLLLAGSYIIEEDGEFYNQLIIINSNGIDIAKYNKNHLFPQLREKILFAAGTTLSILEVWGIKISMAICYDLRFPELFRHYAAHQSEVCIIPAQWPQKRIEHYKALLITRAIENQMIIVSTNIIGKTQNTIFGGCSSIINHEGKIINQLKNEEKSISEQINLNELYELRSTFPVLEDANFLQNQDIVSYKFS
jgi:predicted amidohydrolase